MKRSPMKRSQPRRDWEAARAKVESEGVCRAWRLTSPMTCEGPVEAAHVDGREHDRWGGIFDRVEQTGNWYVQPRRIVPLCKKHHQAYDAHELDLLPYLTTEEQAQAVLDAGGIELARNRICGRAA